MAVELATGYVSVAPSTRGFEGALSSQVGGAGGPAGVAAGRSFGASFTPGAKMAALGAAGIATAAFVGAFKIGESFDEAFDTIRLGTGQTGEALEGLKDDFRGVVSRVPADFGDASNAITDLNTRMGLSGQPLQDMAGQMLNLSRLTGSDVQGNIESVTRLFGDWGVEGEDAAGALDMVFRASQETGPSVDRLSQMMVQFGAPMRQFGFSMEESAALLGSFEKEGVNTELVMGSLRQAMGNFARDGKDMRTGLDETISSIQEMGPGAEATALAMDVFGARAGPDMAAAIQEGRFELGEMVDAIENGSDTIEDAAGDTDSFSESWQLLKNNALLAIEPVAVAVFDALSTGMQWLAEYVMPRFRLGLQVISDWWERNGPQIIDAAQAIWDGITTGIEVLVDVFQTAFDVIQTVVETVTAAIQAAWDRFGDVIMSAAEAVWGAIQGIVSGAMSVIQGVIDVVMGIITGDWSRAWDGVKGIVTGVWSAITGAVSGAIGLVRSYLTSVARILGDLLHRPFNAAKDYVQERVDQIVGFVRGIPSMLQSGLSSLVDVLTWPFRTAFNAIARLWNGSVGQLSFSVPSWVPGGIGGQGFSMPQIPTFHRGGVVPGAPGQEVFALLEAGERVVPAGGADDVLLAALKRPVYVMLDGRKVGESVGSNLRTDRRSR